MRCKRICRELLWLARFGEFGPSSAPHLDHLAGCAGCRDEVGFDRALVHQLRVALAERIANEEPSSGAWSVILARAQAPERGVVGFLRGHAVSLASRLRTATAVTAMALAGIIATSTQVAITHPQAGSAETEVRQGGHGLDERFELRPLVPRPRQVATPVVYVPAVAPLDPEAAFLVGATLPSAASAAAEEPAPDEAAVESVVVIAAPFSRLTPADPVDGRYEPAPEVTMESVDVPAEGPY
jgi:hypothetical protein